MIDRIYVVTDVTSGKMRLIRAKSQVLAHRFVSKSSFSVDLAKQDELVSLLGEGVQVEDAESEKEVTE